MSDVKLVNEQVVIEAWDLCVDSPDRRKNDTPYRRAFVHDYDDGLTINWANDYPGGVTLAGVKKVEGYPTPEWGRTILIDTDALILKAKSILAAEANMLTTGDLDINGNISFIKDTKFQGKIKLVSPGNRRVRAKEIDLGQAISTLQAEVNDLKEKLAKLETKIA